MTCKAAICHFLPHAADVALVGTYMMLSKVALTALV